MADIENKYYQVVEDGVLSEPVTGKHWFKVAMMPIALIGGSCLMLLLVAAAMISSPAFHANSAAEPTNLVAFSPVSGAVKPGIMNPLISSPFRKIATSEKEANKIQHMRDVKVQADDVDAGWSAVPGEIRDAEKAKILKSFAAWQKPDGSFYTKEEMYRKGRQFVRDWEEPDVVAQASTLKEGSLQQSDVTKIIGGIVVGAPIIAVTLSKVFGGP